jgi:hypothetical protein
MKGMLSNEGAHLLDVESAEIPLWQESGVVAERRELMAI